MDINLDQLKSTKLELQNLPHNQYWQIPVEGAEYLYQTVLRLKPSLILEIGTSSGYSALWLIEALLASPSTQNSRLITIESNADRFDFASQNFKKAGVESLIQNIKGHAPEVFIQIDLSPSIDLAFFDGTKSQTTDFFKSIWPILSAQGEILVDNVNSHRPKMQPFLDYLSTQNIPFTILDIGAGICRIQKDFHQR